MRHGNAPPLLRSPLCTHLTVVSQRMRKSATECRCLEDCALRSTCAMSLRGALGTSEPYLGRILPIVQKRVLKSLERVARERSSRA
jgi:hypothetical protein